MRITKPISLKDDPGVVVVRGSAAGFSQSIEAGNHELKSDEPLGVGGTDTGPSPYDLLLGSPRILHINDCCPLCKAQAVAT